MRANKDFKEIARTDKLLFICPFCNLSFKALAYHTRQVHKIKARDLRKMFNLKSNYQLITPYLKARHRDIAIEFKQGEALKHRGLKTRYKKGSIGHIKKNWSNQALKELSDRRHKEV